MATKKKTSAKEPKSKTQAKRKANSKSKTKQTAVKSTVAKKVSKKGQSSKSKSSTNATQKSEPKVAKLSVSTRPITSVKDSACKIWNGFRQNKILFNLVLWLVIFFVSLIVVDYGVQYLNYHASAALVNGERIYVRDFHSKLEESYGQTIIGQMIDEKLIYQAAEEENVVILEEDIDKEMKQLEKDYGGKENLESELSARNTSKEELREKIRTVLIVQEILGKNIKISEEDKMAFFEEYKDVLFAENEDPSYEESEERIEEILKEQQISQKLQPWLADLKATANIQNNIENPKKFEFLRITKAFINDILERSLPEDKEEKSE